MMKKKLRATAAMMMKGTKTTSIKLKSRQKREKFVRSFFSESLGSIEADDNFFFFSYYSAKKIDILLNIL